jgi:hypothetical protein
MRRRIIAQLLSIPPALLGLASLENVVIKPQKKEHGHSNIVNVNTLQKVLSDIDLYQRNVHIALRLHITNNAHDLIYNIDKDLRDLEQLEQQASGDFLYQVRELLVSNNLLASRIMRDRRQYALAYKYANSAVQAAKNMKDNELLAAAKHTRGLLKLAWGQCGTIEQGLFQVDRNKIQSAIQDFQDILNQMHAQSDSVHPQLRGYTMIQLSRALGVLEQGRRGSMMTNAQTLVEQVADVVGKETIDDLYTRALVTGATSGLHLGGYLLHRANIFNTFGMPGKAITELNNLKKWEAKNYGRDGTRMQVWTDIVRSEALMGLGEYAEATEKAKGALIVCHAINSGQNVATLIDIHGRLARSSYKASEDVKELGDMLKEWYGIE